MHEMSIARNIVEIVEDAIRDRDEIRVAEVHVAIGGLVAVINDSLHFCYDAIIPNTKLAGSTLVIEDVPIRARCGDCHEEFDVDAFVFVCPRCGGHSATMTAGDELVVRKVEVH